MRPDRAALLLLALAVASCKPNGPEFRHYREISIAPPPHEDHTPAPAMDMSGPVAQADVALAWDTPSTWTEMPASGPRLATFGVDGMECTITSFPGTTGGLEANIRRWLGQLNAQRTEEEISKFAQEAESFETAGGLRVTLLDFAALLPADSPTSMLAGVTELNDATVFVKLMGPPEKLAAEKNRFRALCASLKSRTP